MNNSKLGGTESQTSKHEDTYLCERGEALGALLFRSSLAARGKILAQNLRDLSAEEEGEVFAEIVAFFVSYVDRLAYGALGDSARSVYMNAAIDEIIEYVAEQPMYFESPQECSQYLESLIPERIAQYGVFPDMGSHVYSGACVLVENYVRYSDEGDEEDVVEIGKSLSIAGASLIGVLFNNGDGIFREDESSSRSTEPDAMGETQRGEIDEEEPPEDNEWMDRLVRDANNQRLLDSDSPEIPSAFLRYKKFIAEDWKSADDPRIRDAVKDLLVVCLQEGVDDFSVFVELGARHLGKDMMLLQGNMFTKLWNAMRSQGGDDFLTPARDVRDILEEGGWLDGDEGEDGDEEMENAPLDPEGVRATVKMVVKWVKAGSYSFGDMVNRIADTIGDESTQKAAPYLIHTWSYLKDRYDRDEQLGPVESVTSILLRREQADVTKGDESSGSDNLQDSDARAERPTLETDTASYESELVEGDYEDEGLGIELVVVISKDDVESADIASTLEVLDEVFEDTEGYECKVELLFFGYDADPRELYEIPEVRRFCQLLDHKFPYWFYFASRNTDTLKAFTYCCINVTPLRSGLVVPNPQEFGQFLMTHFQALNEITQDIEFGEEENLRITDEVMEYYESGAKQ